MGKKSNVSNKMLNIKKEAIFKERKTDKIQAYTNYIIELNILFFFIKVAY